MCDKAGDTYPSTKKYVPDQYKTKQMCNRVVDRCHFVLDSVPGQYKTQEMCDKIVPENPFNIVMIDLRLKKWVRKPLIFYQH